MLKDIMLATFRVHKNKDNPYVQIHKEYLSNKHLSWRAKGILTYLLSKPDNWIVRVEDIRNHAKEADRAVRSGIQELIDQGHLIRNILRDDGKFQRFEYDVYESPTLQSSPFRHFSKMDALLNNDNKSYNEIDEDQLKTELEAHGLTWSPDMKEH